MNKESNKVNVRQYNGVNRAVKWINRAVKWINRAVKCINRAVRSMSDNTIR
jgi:hypothetical protein